MLSQHWINGLGMMCWLLMNRQYGSCLSVVIRYRLMAPRRFRAFAESKHIYALNILHSGTTGLSEKLLKSHIHNANAGFQTSYLHKILQQMKNVISLRIESNFVNVFLYFEYNVLSFNGLIVDH